MTNGEYEQWWQLHLRVATGEALADKEKMMYQVGLELLEHEEATQLSRDDLSLLRSLRTRMQTLVQLQNKLLMQSARLDEKITELERTYQQLTGFDLAVDVYATT